MKIKLYNYNIMSKLLWNEGGTEQVELKAGLQHFNLTSIKLSIFKNMCIWIAILELKYCIRNDILILLTLYNLNFSFNFLKNS